MSWQSYRVSELTQIWSSTQSLTLVSDLISMCQFIMIKTFMQQTNLFLFLLFALSFCIINKIYCMMFNSDKIYKLLRSSIKKEFSFLIIHSFTFNNLYSNEFASQNSRNINYAFIEKK